MTHEAARQRLLDLACGELSGREAARVEAHASGCDACRAELATLRETRRLMAGLGELPAPARGEAELLAAARAAAAESAARPRPWRLPAWFLGASAAAAALVTVTAVSYRLLTAAPARRDDAEALLGSGTAPALEQSARAPAAPPAAPSAKGAGGPGAAPGSSGPPPPAPPVVAAAPERASDARAPEAPAQQGALPAAKSPRARAEARREAPAADLAPAGSAATRSSGPSVGIAEAPAAGVQAAPAPEARPLAAAPDALTGPSRSTAAAPAPAREAAPRAAVAGAGPIAEPATDAVARWQRLRAGGDLRREVVTFLDCPGESWREVETDPRGRVVRYVRHGLAGGVPFEAELYYADDGALGAVRYREAQGRWRELRLLGAPGPAAHVPAPALDPARAGDAAATAPPRCRF